MLTMVVLVIAVEALASEDGGFGSSYYSSSLAGVEMALDMVMQDIIMQL